MAAPRDIGPKIVELHKQGFSYSQIVSELGCSKGTVAFHCGKGQKELAKGRTRDRRNKIRRYIQEVKTGVPCADCKEIYPYWMMEFDHLRDKSFTIATVVYQLKISLERLKEEIAKCEIVCSNCHKNRTHWRLVKTGADVLDFENLEIA